MAVKEIKHCRHARHAACNTRYFSKQRRRVDYQSRRINTFSVIPNETIKLSNKTVNLLGICCFDGEENDGHYTAYYVCNKKWYRYNDISKKLILKVADNFDSLISLEKEGNHIKKYALLYFYC